MLLEKANDSLVFTRHIHTYKKTHTELTKKTEKPDGKTVLF
jgi:hypothetical protein